MDRTDQARTYCAALRRLWLAADEREREQISAEISALTDRGAWLSMTERVLTEMRGPHD